MFEQTKYFNIGRKSFLIWRFIQLWIFCNILILEIIQVLGYSQYYWRHPANDQARVWIIEGISFAIIGYLLINFNRRWKVGPAKDDIILDWILLIIWSIQCFLNLTPSLVGNGFDCNITTSPYNIKTRDEQSRCYLFFSSTIISFVALFITLITLILSITRWKNRKFLQLSMNSYNMRSQKSYLVQEGSLENGEPVLLFYSKSKSLNGGIHGKMIRNPIAKSKRVSPSPINPINITISEPEIAATAYHSKEIPNDEEKYDDSILKY